MKTQNVAGIASPDFWLGIFGLDPAPSNYTTLNDPQPNFLWSLNDTNVIPSTSWAYTAGATYSKVGTYFIKLPYLTELRRKYQGSRISDFRWL